MEAFASDFGAVPQRVVIQMLDLPLDRNTLPFNVRDLHFLAHKNNRLKVAECRAI